MSEGLGNTVVMASNPDRACEELASRQYGLITRVQAIELGLTERQIRTRKSSTVWDSLLPNVFRVAGAPESWMQRLCAACLWAGDTAVASHYAAGALWQLDGYFQGRIEISSSKFLRAPTKMAVTVHHSRDLDRRDRWRTKGIPVTNIERTIIDLAGVRTARATEKTLDNALVRELTTVKKLRCRLEDLRAHGRPGIALLTKLLKEREGNAIGDSNLEEDILKAIRKAGLPEPTLQYEVYDSEGLFIRKIDIAYPEHGILIEADSYLWHSAKSKFDKDLSDRNRMEAAEYKVLHVTKKMLKERPQEFTRQLAAMLARAERRQTLSLSEPFTSFRAL
jgi:hypothetical protein